MSPKDSRALVLPLLFIYAVNILPAFYLRPLWSAGAAFALLAFRAWLWFTKRPMPPRSLRWLAQITAGAGVWVAFPTLLGDEAAGTLLLLLAGLKLFELVNKRDFFIATILHLLLLMGYLLADQSLPISLFTLLDVAILLGYLSVLEASGFANKVSVHSRLPGVWMAVKALPLMVVLFVLFPRFSTGFGQGDGAVGQAGVSDKLRPGSVSRLIQSDELVFRATFTNGVTPPTSELYWRGAVLDHGHGLNWDRLEGERAVTSPSAGAAEVEILLEPGNERMLFSLGTTTTVRMPNDLSGKRVLARGGGIFELDRPLAGRERYALFSGPLARSPITDDALPINLKVDATIGDTTVNLARKLKRETAVETAHATLQYFHESGFTYTLSPKPARGMGEFLTQTRQGFCEHYAAAMATLLRVNGVPSRVVVGFQGGTPSLLEHFVSVRERDAHAWVEYHDGTRWRRADPTAEVEPERIAIGSSAYTERNSGVDLWWARGRALFDEVDARWTGFLVRFDLARQQELLANFGMEGVLFSALPLFMVFALILTLAIIYFLEAQKRETLGPTEALYRQTLRRLQRLKLGRTPFEGPVRWGQRLKREAPNLSQQVAPILDELTRLRFGPDQPPAQTCAELKALRQKMAVIRWRRL